MVFHRAGDDSLYKPRSLKQQRDRSRQPTKAGRRPIAIRASNRLVLGIDYDIDYDGHIECINESIFVNIRKRGTREHRTIAENSRKDVIQILDADFAIAIHLATTPQGRASPWIQG